SRSPRAAAGSPYERELFDRQGKPMESLKIVLLSVLHGQVTARNGAGETAWGRDDFCNTPAGSPAWPRTGRTPRTTSATTSSTTAAAGTPTTATGSGRAAP